MAIKGSLKEASLPDVLQLLAMGKKTGCLSVTHRSNFGYIFFEKGRICYASIVNRRDRLGDMLVKNSVISQDQLENAIGAQSKTQDATQRPYTVPRTAWGDPDLQGIWPSSEMQGTPLERSAIMASTSGMDGSSIT